MDTAIYKWADGYEVVLFNENGVTDRVWRRLETEAEAEALAEGVREAARKLGRARLGQTRFDGGSAAWSG